MQELLILEEEQVEERVLRKLNLVRQAQVQQLGRSAKAVLGALGHVEEPLVELIFHGEQRCLFHRLFGLRSLGDRLVLAFIAHLEDGPG